MRSLVRWVRPLSQSPDQVLFPILTISNSWFGIGPCVKVFAYTTTAVTQCVCAPNALQMHSLYCLPVPVATKRSIQQCYYYPNNDSILTPASDCRQACRPLSWLVDSPSNSPECHCRPKALSVNGVRLH